ncbi:hypothetical protein [Amycolatopsis tolypomycina]|nr:hypothetical protein [Amycolatopsis tolypomycina]
MGPRPAFLDSTYLSIDHGTNTVGFTYSTYLRLGTGSTTPCEQAVDVTP